MRHRLHLIGIACLAAALAGCGDGETEAPFEGLRVVETEYGGLDAFTVENSRICVTFVPALGGRITEYTLKETGHNVLWANPEVKPSGEVGQDEYYPYGGLDDHLDLEGRSRYPTPLTRAPYTHKVTLGADDVVVKLTYEGEGWKLERTHVIYRDSTRLSTCEIVTNLGDEPRELTPRPHPVFAVGGEADNVDVILQPACGAVLVQRYAEPYGRDLSLPSRGSWAAAVDTKAREAVVLTFGDDNDVEDVNLWFAADSYNVEPMRTPRALAKGETLSMTFDMNILSGDDLAAQAAALPAGGSAAEEIASAMKALDDYAGKIASIPEENFFLASRGVFRVQFPNPMTTGDDVPVIVFLTPVEQEESKSPDVQVHVLPKGEGEPKEIKLSERTSAAGMDAWNFPVPVKELDDAVHTLRVSVGVGDDRITLSQPLIVVRKPAEEIEKMRASEKDPYKPKHAAAAFYLARAKRRGEAVAKTPLAGKLPIDEIEQDLQRVRDALAGKLLERKTGEFTRFYTSTIDDTAQGYRLFVPDNYAKETAWPLVVDLHGRDPSFSPFNPDHAMRYLEEARKHGCIYVMPHGRGNLGYRGSGADDVLTVIEHVRADYNLDPRRIYLTGTSMGGGGAWRLATRYPGRFAAVAPVFGLADYTTYAKDFDKLPAWERFRLESRGSVAMAENLPATPVFTYHGVKDATVGVEHTRHMVARMRELGCEVIYEEDPDGVHRRPRGLGAKVFDFLLKHNLAEDPKTIVLRTPYLRFGKNRWATLDGLSRPLAFAEINATKKDKVVEVTTKNVSAFTLKMDDALAQARASLSVFVNGDSTLAVRVPVTGEVSFHVKDDPRTDLPAWVLGKPEAGGPRDFPKDADTEGPMSDVFRTRFILVVGTTGDAEADAVCRDEAEWFVRNVWRRVQHVEPIIRTDDEITAGDFRRANLVLIGGPKLNRITERLQPGLPVTFLDDGTIVVDERELKPPHGALAMIHPNPAYPSHYVLVLAGSSLDATKGIFRRTDMRFDYHALNETTKDLDTAALFGVFDQQWKFDRRCQWPERDAEDAADSADKDQQE